MSEDFADPREDVGHWTKWNNDWKVSAPPDLGRNFEINVITKAGKVHRVKLTKKLGENEHGGVYDYTWPDPIDYGRWVKRNDSYCIHAPKGCKEGDEIQVKKKDGEIQGVTLNVHIEDNFWYTKEQRAECSECGEKGPTGEPCQICYKGHYSY